MNQQQALLEFNTLPPPAQQEVLDFIAFFRARYAQQHSQTAGTSSDMREEAFVGMWRDRNDMKNSSEWVRSMRISEWG